MVQAFFVRIGFLRPIRKREKIKEIPTQAYTYLAPESYSAGGNNPNAADGRSPILFDASNLRASHVNTVHLVARQANGEQLGGSGIEIIFEGARFVLTSAKNIGEFDRVTKEVDPYAEMAAFKKRKGTEYGEELVLSSFATHPNYNGEPECGFDIAVIKV